MEAIFALFSTFEEARTAIKLLIERRFRPDNMNVIASDYSVKDRFRGRLDRMNILARELEPGLEKLVAGVQPLDTPDAGQVHAAGDEAATLVKAAHLAQARSAGLEAALEEFGLPRQVAQDSIQAIRGGGVLFWVKTEDARAAEAALILRDHKGRHVGHYAGAPLPG